MYPLKTITQNASFQKRSPERRFLKTPFSCFGWMNSYFFTYYVTVFDTNKCACSLKRWDCFSPFSSPEPLGLICNEPVEPPRFKTTWPRNDGLWGREWFQSSWRFRVDWQKRFKNAMFGRGFFRTMRKDPQLSKKKTITCLRGLRS